MEPGDSSAAGDAPGPATGTTRVGLVLNPVARWSARARHAVENACAAAGLEPPTILLTEPGATGRAQAESLLRDRVDRIVVAGGDGTVREVVAPLLDPDQTPGPTLGVVPIGTANLFARNLRLPVARPEACALVAVRSPGRPTDLGRVTLTTPTGSTTMPFLVVVGIGHDAETVADVDPGLKQRARWVAYLTPGLRRMRQGGLPLTVRLDADEAAAEEVWSVLAVNGGRLPAGAQVVPGARVDDGLLHLALVAPRHLADWGRIALTGVSGWRRDWPALRYHTGRAVEVRSTLPVTAQVDGDPVAEVLQVRAELLPGVLRVAAPG